MKHPVHLVRHGQSEWNVRRLTQGQTAHPPLTDLGRAQATRAARLVAADLATSGAAPRVVSSDLVRAVQTAEVVAAQLGVAVELDARLREQHLGELQGRSYDETWALAETVDWTDPTARVPGGETAGEVHARVAAALEEHRGDGPVVLVSHGDAIRAAVAHVHGVPPHLAPWVEVPNGAVARVAPGATRVAWLSGDETGADLV